MSKTKRKRSAAELKAKVALEAIQDGASRKVLSWRLANTQNADFCVAAFEDAFLSYCKSEIFDTGQGRQFASYAFTSATIPALTLFRSSSVR